MNCIMLTSDCFTDLEKHLEDKRGQLKEQGWDINYCKVKRPETAIKFLGILWSGKTRLIPEKATEKTKEYKAIIGVLRTLVVLVYFPIPTCSSCPLLYIT